MGIRGLCWTAEIESRSNHEEDSAMTYDNKAIIRNAYHTAEGNVQRAAPR